MLNVANQEQLIAALTMSKEERLEKAKEYDFHSKKKIAAGEEVKEPEDTVSEADLDSSDEDQESKSNTKDSMRKGKVGTMGSSKYSHSRFSSNAGDLSDLENDIAVL